MIILGNNDGCVIARNRLAKTIAKIPMGAPLHQIQHLIRKHQVVVCSANFPLYGDMSRRVMDVLSTFTHEAGLEYYSVDEAFIDISATPKAERVRYAEEMRATVRQHTGIVLSIGVGASKTIAKLASDQSKELPNGVLALQNEADLDQLLATLQVDDIWGIGAQRGNLCRSQKIITALDFKRANSVWVKKHLSVTGLRTQLELRGVSCLPLVAVRDAKKQICCTRAFGHPITDLSDIREALAVYVTRAGERLRAQHSLASSLTVFVSTNPFHEDQPQYSKSCTLTLPRATNITSEMIAAAHHAVTRIYRPGIAYHRAGITLSGLTDDTFIQPNLFTEIDERAERLQAIIEAINRKFGRDTIRSAATGIEQAWQMKQQQQSPHFTTNWRELPRVR